MRSTLFVLFSTGCLLVSPLNAGATDRDGCCDPQPQCCDSQTSGYSYTAPWVSGRRFLSYSDALQRAADADRAEASVKNLQAKLAKLETALVQANKERDQALADAGSAKKKAAAEHARAEAQTKAAGKANGEKTKALAAMKKAQNTASSANKKSAQLEAELKKVHGENSGLQTALKQAQKDTQLAKAALEKIQQEAVLNKKPEVVDESADKKQPAKDDEATASTEKEKKTDTAEK